MYNFLPHSEETRKEMLAEIGIDKVEDLFYNIDAGARLRESLNIADGISELEVQKKLAQLSGKNKNASNSTFFIGGGTYNRFIPACINTIAQRFEFITAYTPYQPEISQGTLQVMYEYQTMISNLTGMDVSNASVYDAATACAEAILMASRATRKFRALVPSTISPEYAKVIETYCYGAGIEVDFLPAKEGIIDIDRLKSIDDLDEYACILVQTPNYLGCIESVHEISQICKESKPLFVVCADPTSLSVVEAPGNYGADIVVGDVQPLGIPMSFGGPHGGFIATTKKYMRQLPGRIAGMTEDEDGKRAFTLTLQAREQHIRREKATSNICSNQALVSLCSTVYMSVMGFEGIKEAACTSIQRAHYLADKISGVKGFKVLYDNYLNEFVVRVNDNISIDELLSELEQKNIFGGIKLEDNFEQFKNCILICVTEMNNIDDIYLFINSLNEISTKYNLEEVA